MAKNRPFRYDAGSVVRAGTSRSRGPASEPETVRTGTASAIRMALARRRGERERLAAAGSPPLPTGAPWLGRQRSSQRCAGTIGWHHEPSSRDRARAICFREQGSDRGEKNVVISAEATIELVPVMRERLADLETPVSAFAKLRPLGGAFLLESAEGGERMGRYSFIGVAPRTRLYFRDGEVVAERDAADVDFDVPRRPSADAMTHALAPDPLDALRAELARYRRASHPGLPRFSGSPHAVQAKSSPLPDAHRVQANAIRSRLLARAARGSRSSSAMSVTPRR